MARRYVPGTNVLETSWMTDTGWFVVRDALALAPARRARTDGACTRASSAPHDAEHLLVRTVECVHGTVEIETVCEPAFDYATEEARWKLVDRDALAADASGGGETLRLLGDIPLEIDGPVARGTRTLEAGERCFSCLSWREELSGPSDAADAVGRVDCTVELWRRWLRGGDVSRPPVALDPAALGAGAQGTDLRADRGDGRGADDLAARDAGRGAQLGLPLHLDPGRDLHPLEPARDRLRPGGARVHGVRRASLFHGRGPETQIMFGIGGETELTEKTLDHLSGYVGSRPVRVGNAAYDQRQNDVYGALLDSIYIHSKTREGVPEQMAPIVFEQAEAAASAWRLPDQGIWEARGEPKHYVSSKLMCWVALDRAARLATDRGSERARPTAGSRRRTRCRPRSSSGASASGASSASTTRPTRSTPRCC